MKVSTKSLNDKRSVGKWEENDFTVCANVHAHTFPLETELVPLLSDKAVVQDSCNTIRFFYMVSTPKHDR